MDDHTNNNNIVKYNLDMFDENDKITNIHNNTVCKKFTIDNIEYTYDNSLKEGWVLQEVMVTIEQILIMKNIKRTKSMKKR